MSNTAWFNCFSGIAGDMALGSLVDAGANIDDVRAQLEQLNVEGWTLDSETTERHGIRATHITVNTDDTTQHRRLGDIQVVVDRAQLGERVKQRALTVFTRLAQAEAAVHGISPDEVHFHEVGALDAIVDVVGTCIALELLDVDHVAVSSIANGHGYVNSAHGILPVPAPAVVKLLHGVPTHGIDVDAELTTPTGAAIVSALAGSFGSMPAMTQVVASGFGAGTRDFTNMANCTQVIIGERTTTDTAVIIETNIDDATGEVLAHTVERLFAAGVDDAWITPIVMKKGRPAYQLSALTTPQLAPSIARMIVDETGTFGVRNYSVEKTPAQRDTGTVVIDGDTIGVKIGAHRVKAEFDDTRDVACRNGRPVRDIIRDAERAWADREDE